MRLPFHRASIRVRLLLASTTVQVVLLSLLLANSVRLMNDAASASLDTTISQNASMLHAMATAYGEQQRYEALEDVLGELLAGTTEGLVLRAHRRTGPDAARQRRATRHGAAPRGDRAGYRILLAPAR